MVYANSKGESHHKYDVLNYLYSKLNFLTRFEIVLSRRILTTHLVILLYIIRKRLVNFLCAVRISENFLRRKLAWDSEVSISVIHIPKSPSKMKSYLKEIKKIHVFIDDALYSIKKFYQDFFCLHVVLMILGSSFTLCFSALERKRFTLRC